MGDLLGHAGGEGLVDPIDEAVASFLDVKAAALVARDRATLDPLIHADFVYVSASGIRVDKARYIDSVCGPGGLRFIRQASTNVRIQQHGDCAVIIADIDDRVEIGGLTRELRLKTMLALVKEDGRWRWLAGQTMQPIKG